MNGRERVHALEAGLDTAVDTTIDTAIGREPGLDARANDAAPFGGLVTRAIRSQQLWLTVGYFVALLLLARAYS